MIKYSKEWKIKIGAWVQAHTDSYGNKIYKVHYIRNENEYSTGKYWSEKEALESEECSNYANA
jgi:hypothetical protein